MFLVGLNFTVADNTDPASTAGAFIPLGQMPPVLGLGQFAPPGPGIADGRQDFPDALPDGGGGPAATPSGGALQGPPATAYSGCQQAARAAYLQALQDAKDAFILCLQLAGLASLIACMAGLKFGAPAGVKGLVLGCATSLGYTAISGLLSCLVVLLEALRNANRARNLQFCICQTTTGGVGIPVVCVDRDSFDP